MIRLLILAAMLQCTFTQQYQQKVAPGVPPQNYQNYQQPPPPPPKQQQQYQQPPPQQQYQPPPPQQQQYQQQVPSQQMPVQNQQMPVQNQQIPVQNQQIPVQNQQIPQQNHGHSHGHGDPQILNAANIAQEREHIQEHMDVPIDVSKMSDQELQFHYYKMHDADNNNKLDGCELIKSLIHWHGQVDKDHPSYTDKELEAVLEHAFKHTDLNNDGYIDYLEYRISTVKAKLAETPNPKRK